MTPLLIVVGAWLVVALLLCLAWGAAAREDQADLHDGASMRQQRAERWAEIRSQSDRAADEFCRCRPDRRRHPRRIPRLGCSRRPTPRKDLT